MGNNKFFSEFVITHKYLIYSIVCYFILEQVRQVVQQVEQH